MTEEQVNAYWIKKFQEFMAKYDALPTWQEKLKLLLVTPPGDMVCMAGEDVMDVPTWQNIELLIQEHEADIPRLRKEMGK